MCLYYVLWGLGDGTPTAAYSFDACLTATDIGVTSLNLFTGGEGGRGGGSLVLERAGDPDVGFRNTVGIRDGGDTTTATIIIYTYVPII